MKYIIVTREPITNRLKVNSVHDETGKARWVAEYSTREKAEHAAHDIPLCEKWGFEILGVSLPHDHSASERCL
jgi:hypothetical protein